MHSENLFTNYSQIENNAPLADKLRPKNLEDFFGQQLILNDNSLLRSAILNDKISNFIFSGPPGVGKTTLIEIISFNTRSKLIKLNASSLVLPPKPPGSSSHGHAVVCYQSRCGRSVGTPVE